MRTAQESVHLVAATIGFVSYAALWAGALWGSVLRSGWATSRVRHQTVHGIHMHLILLGLTLGVVHALVQAVAPYGKVRAIDVVVPFGDRADPVGIGLGVLALELMIATALSVLVQRKLGYARWRALHSLGYLSFTMVAAHLLISGTEVYEAPLRAAIAASWAVVLVAGIATVTPVARMPRAVLDRLSPRHRAEEVTVSVDPGKCGSFGFCEQEAPGIFTLRSDQRLAYRSVVGSDQAEPALRAAAVCPARAIKLGRLPATVVVSQPTADTSTVSPLATALTPHTGSLPAGTDPHTDPHTGPLPRIGAAVPDLRAGTLARMAAVAEPATGPQPRVPKTDTGAFPLGAGPQPRMSHPDTGPLRRVATGPQPRMPSVDTGALPRAATGPQPRIPNSDTGSFPHAATGPQPRIPNSDTGSFPRVATGPQPRMTSVDTGSFPHTATGPQPRMPSVDTGSFPRAATGPQPRIPGAADAPLPGPDQLQDTGRHHLPRLRGIAGGRS